MQAVCTSNVVETVEGVPVSVPAEWQGSPAKDDDATRFFLIFAVLEPMTSVETTSRRPPRIVLKRRGHMLPGP